ncbi:MAG: urease accessory protein UreF [Saliniramus fredricksonii]|uniref:Urease accessory protein UreF n=1 Tax=Saliniramus fredricksonii TaxID=1653334 RepID=A0A0P7Y2M7_9HYPH|nr:urease accessory UreF family protein [Saliniramus fredricksonii]KPQ10717.1 MAG: urease accessory protein UreF [Saliniramus fredricksonii]SCC79578.1 urease accessory protein [Saliniramus fredricksonii]
MSAHLPLMIWFSPGFPVGAFAYSHALEWACESGEILQAQDLAAWLNALLDHGSGRNDALFLIAAHRASDEPVRLAELAALARSLAGSRERRLETCMQGDAFLTAIASAWPCATVETWQTKRPVLDGAEATPYPVAVGMAGQGHGLPLQALLEAYLAGFIGNLVSAAIRLGAIGQTDGQRIIAGLLPGLPARAAALISAHDGEGLDESLGGCVFASDLGAILHETQYTRLFRS